MEIVKFDWDNAKGEDWNGRQLIIGQRLPDRENNPLYKYTKPVAIYGISMDIVDNSKDFRMKLLSCADTNIVSPITEISKEEARKLLIAKIDEALDILYDPAEMSAADTEFNVPFDEDESEDT